MKCEKCNNLEATFHYSSTINGNKTEAHLCSECARKLGYGNLIDYSPMATAHNAIGELFNEFFGSTRSFMTPFYSFGTSFPSIMPISEQGFSCADGCESAVEIPPSADDDIRKRRELAALKYQLETAIGEENFEKAIELRDKIKQMEQ